MIRLNLNPEPVWLDIVPGVRFRVAPINTALISAAQQQPEMKGLALDATREQAALAMAKAIGSLAILEWEGVADADGYPLAPTPQTIGAVLDLYPVFEAFQIGYVAKGLLLESEKNVSAPSPSGTSEGATDTAQPVPVPAKTARRG